MGDAKGFMKHTRKDFSKEPVEERLRHWKEFVQLMDEGDIQEQGARCMDCGIPFCHWGCPIGNIIPDWNNLVYRGKWKEAYFRLKETNNFPEFTGRVCPAPCEHSCVLAINQPAVAIKNIELSIIEKAYEAGWVVPCPPKKRTGKKVAVIGSGPAGLACVDQLNQSGHQVILYEKNDFVGGLLALGIPDFKLEKSVIERRVDIMRQEGVTIKTGVSVGQDIKARYLLKENDAIVLAGGAEMPRDLPVPGRELEGVFQAMDYLPQQNLINRDEGYRPENRIDAKGKHVIVLGGGDTGSDCVGTANRQDAKSVKQFELMPCPPNERECHNPWPQWALVYRKSSSHEEGVEQDYCIMTKSLSGEKGKLKKLHAVRLKFGERDPQTGRRSMTEVPGSEFEVDCDMLVLAMGFTGPVRQGMLDELDVNLDERGNVQTDPQYMSSVPGVFSCGDMRRGQSLIVWAIHEGRSTAAAVSHWLSTKK